MCGDRRADDVPVLSGGVSYFIATHVAWHDAYVNKLNIFPNSNYQF